MLALASALDCILSGRKESAESLKYLNHTYSCITRSLQEHDQPPVATVAVVMGLTIHEELLARPINTKVHMDALDTMVRLRGGVTSFQEYPILMQKIFRYVLRLACVW